MSARKEARSAHVEMLKMVVRDEGGQERTAPTPRRPPITPQGERVPWSIFVDMHPREAFPTQPSVISRMSDRPLTWPRA